MRDCWIIGEDARRAERGATARLYWRAAANGRSAWVGPEEATRLARREDAEAVIAHLGGRAGLRAAAWDFEPGAKARPSGGGS